MNMANQAYISGTTLAQFVSAAYACTEGCKHVYNLYGLRQNARELTDKPESAVECEVVVICATPTSAGNAPPNVMKLGYLTICQAPVHKLSFADVQRLKAVGSPDLQDPEILFHFTKVDTADGISRVLYTLYECRGSACDAPRPLKLNVDNLVDSLQGFTKIANVFTRSSSTMVADSTSTAAAEKENGENVAVSCHDVEALAREKAVLVKRIVELTKSLNVGNKPS